MKTVKRTLILDWNLRVFFGLGSSEVLHSLGCCFVNTSDCQTHVSSPVMIHFKNMSSLFTCSNIFWQLQHGFVFVKNSNILGWVLQKHISNPRHYLKLISPNLAICLSVYLAFEQSHDDFPILNPWFFEHFHSYLMLITAQIINHLQQLSSLNNRYQSKTVSLDKVSWPNAFWSISNIWVSLIAF